MVGVESSQLGHMARGSFMHNAREASLQGNVQQACNSMACDILTNGLMTIAVRPVTSAGICMQMDFPAPVAMTNRLSFPCMKLLMTSSWGPLNCV